MNENVIATKPHLVISRQGNWYIYFSVRNPRTGLLEPVKKEKGFKLCSDDEERRQLARKLIREYTMKLKKGWTPWKNDEYFFEDQIMYKTEAEAYGSRRRKAKESIRLHVSNFLYFKKQSLKQKGYASYQSKFRIFTQWLEIKGFGEYDIKEISNDIILSFFNYLINERGLDKVTIDGYKVRITAMFKWLQEAKVIKDNPMYNIPTGIKRCDHSPRPILPGDINELLERIEKHDPQLYLACLMQFFCAIRPGTELRLLRIKDIDFWNGSIHINIVDSKKERNEVVAVPKQLLSLMTDIYQLHRYEKELYVFSQNGLPGDTPLGKNNFRNRFNRHRDSLRLSKEYKFYSFKHTGANMMMESGNFNIRELMEHLRHTDMESTFHYIRRYRGASSEKIREQFPDPWIKK